MKSTPLLYYNQNHYYPFGLTMAGISSKAVGTLQNKEKTFQGQRFDEELGLNWIEFKWRNHDVQVGRFIEIDPLSEKYVYNSTYAFSENKVIAHVELEGLESVESTSNRSVANGIFNGLKNLAKEFLGYSMPGGYHPESIKAAITGDWRQSVGGLAQGAFPVFQFNASIDKFIAGDNQTKAEMITEIGVPALVGRFTIKNPIIADVEKTESVTLFRGVNESNLAFENAINGKVNPRGGNASVAEHNAGNTKSLFTSWTKNPEVAKNFALRPNGKGVVLEKTFPASKTVASPSVKDVYLK